MKATNQLFDLLKSLTPGEEKVFRLQSSFQQGEKNYIKLYDYIQQQNEYDEGKIKNHFKDDVFVQHFASEKNQLLHHILKSLRKHRKENIKSAMIDEEIRNIEVLFNKSLYKQSRKQLSLLKKKANDYELFYSLLEIVELEKILLDMEASFGDINYTTIDDLINEENAVFNKIENFASYELQHSKINRVSSRLMIARSEEDVEEILRIIKETKKLKETSDFLSKKASIVYLFTIGLANKLLNNSNEVHRIFSELLIEMENKSELISEMPNFYINAHGSLIRNFAIKKQYDDGFQMIDKLKSLSLIEMFKPIDLQISIFTQAYITEVVLYSFIGQHKNAIKIIPVVIKGLDKYESKINDEDLVMIYHSISMLYFGVSDYNKSLHWLNKIINTNYDDLRQDNIRMCKLINLIIHFELGNDDLISYIYKSTLRFFNQLERKYKFEMVFLDYFKKIAISKKEGKHRDTYIKFKEELQKVFTNKYEKNALDYFNFYGWLDSKIHNISFAEAIKIRRQNT